MIGLAIGSDGSSMITRYFLADGQSDARTSVLIFAVQPLENLEDAVHVFLIEADAVIRYVDAVIYLGWTSDPDLTG